MATITRSLTLNNQEIFAAIVDWIREHHPEQELEVETLKMLESKGNGLLAITATWTVTKAVPVTKETP